MCNLRTLNWAGRVLLAQYLAWAWAAAVVAQGSNPYAVEIGSEPRNHYILSDD